MNQARSPLILVGQIYLQPNLNEYLIVTKNNRGQISYEGVGFKGQAEDITFIESFGPVDPIDVEPAELNELLTFCPAETTALVGFVAE